jgi:hypothetical protein
MILERPTPVNLVLKSDANLVWIKAGLFSFGFIGFYGLYWVMVGSPFYGESSLVSIILFLYLIRILSFFRFPTVIANFDKQSGYFTVKKKWILGTKTEAKHPLATINRVQVVQKGEYGKNSRYFKIKIQLISREFVPLSKIHHRPETLVRVRAAALEEFLNLEPTQNLPSDDPRVKLFNKY